MVFEQTSGDSEGQRSLVCCSPWGHKESDVTYQLNNKSKQIFTPRKLYLHTLFFIHLLHRHQPPRRCKSPIKQTKSSNLIQPTILLRSEWVSEVTQLCLTLFNPMDYSLPGSSVHGMFQARVLEWVAISFSRRSSWPRDWTLVSCIVGRHFTIWATREASKLYYFLAPIHFLPITWCDFPKRIPTTWAPWIGNGHFKTETSIINIKL